jgi:hypothetical protein
MKKILLLITGFVFSLILIGQGRSIDKEKGKNKPRNEKSVASRNSEQIAKEKKVKEEHNKKIWEGTFNGVNGPKPSMNQPARVRAAFQRDYPNGTIVSWSKYRGDWTATFGNGLFMSTALYHANGERRDTRTPITRNEMPRNVLDAIFKRSPGTRVEDIIKIEVPNVVTDIFRIKDIIQGKPVYFYYNSDGQLVKYNY